MISKWNFKKFREQTRIIYGQLCITNANFWFRKAAFKGIKIIDALSYSFRKRLILRVLSIPLT